VFQNKFYGEDTSNDELVLEDIKDSSVMQQFLHFLYTDTVETVNEETIKPLLVIADKYDVPRLKIACGAFTADKINNSNCMEILEFAATQNEIDLVNACVKFIGRNIKQDDFDMAQLLSLKTDVFAAILDSDEFPLDELSVFTLANNWYEHNKSTVSENDFRKVLRGVRFPIMDPLTLYSNVKGNPFVDVLDYMEALEYNALPKEFDPDVVEKEKRFHPRKGITRFTWVNAHTNANHLVRLEQHDRMATKLSTNNWDLVLVSSIEMKSGQHYYEIEINFVNNDKSGMVIGVTADKFISGGSYSSCYGLGMTGTTYNAVGGGYGTCTFNNGDIFGTLVDFTKDEIVFFKNGTSIAKSNSTPSSMRNVYACVFLYYTNDTITLLDKPKHPVSSLVRATY